MGAISQTWAQTLAALYVWLWPALMGQSGFSCKLPHLEPWLGRDVPIPRTSRGIWPRAGAPEGTVCRPLRVKE